MYDADAGDYNEAIENDEVFKAIETTNPFRPYLVAGPDAFASIARNYPRILIPLAAASRPSSSYVALSAPISRV